MRWGRSLPRKGLAESLTPGSRPVAHPGALGIIYTYSCPIIPSFPGVVLATTERACPNCSTSLPPEAQFCMHCGTATPTDPGVPPRTQATGAFEVAQVTRALAGRYKIERVIGEGGMATVYLAEDQKHRRKVAVKVMRPELAATLGADRFLREVQIAAQLNHPHILPMHDSGEADGLLYYVMPYVEGETLKEKLERDGAMPMDDALRLAREIAEALAYAHKRGIVHRDIKPANILLNEGHALVADFGIARALDDGGTQVLTKTGLAVGTPQYMAPEQATGEKTVDGRADIYAAGAILYEMLAGEPPFTGQNARAVLTKSLTERPKPVTQVRAGVAPAVDTLVQKALSKSPDERYASGADLVAAIDAARPMSSASVPAITPPQATQVVTRPADGRARPLRLAGIAAIALLVLGGAWFALRSRQPVRLAHSGPARVVVLPFTADGAVEDYLVQGVADEVRARLSAMRGLQIIAPTSAQAYKGSTKSPQEIGRELGADYLLTGTVAMRGGAERAIAVRARLVASQTGEAYWQHEYGAALRDVFALQRDVAAGAAGGLGLAAVNVLPASDSTRPTDNVDAYLLFLKARSLTSRDPPTLRESVGILEQAISLDDKFAEAWALLSVKSSALYTNGSRDPVVAARAKEAYEHAIALDPNGHHGLVAKARYQVNVGADPNGARETLDRALRIAPTDAEALTMSGNLEVDQGNLGTSLSNLERARDVDPRSFNVLINLSIAYQYLGRTQDAIEAAKALVAGAPGNLQAAARLAMTYAGAGDRKGAEDAWRQLLADGVTPPALAAYFAGYNELAFLLDDQERAILFRLTPAAFDNDRAWWGQTLATAYWQQGDTVHARIYADSSLAPSRVQVEASPRDPQLHGLYGLMLAYLGRAKEARAEFAFVLQPSSSNFTQYSYNTLNAAKGELALGEKDRALDILEGLLKRGHYVTRAWLQIDPTFASLKGYPRFETLVKGN